MNAWMSTNRKDPREEGFFECMKYTFAPNLKKRSFITIVSVAHILVFVVSIIVSVTAFSGLNSKRFLGSNPQLLDYFNKNNSDLQHGQFWRFISPVFFHNSFGHLIQNLLT